VERLRTTLTAECAKEHVDSHVTYLCDPVTASPLAGNAEWVRRFPSNPGVYCVFEEDVLIYSGETGSLKGRMRDLLDSRHHILRRHLGTAKFGSHSAYQPATNRLKFPAVIEALLNEFIVGHLRVNAVPVALGRKEIEERILELKSPRYNVKLRRGEAMDGPGL
jgi:hypothetical protein